MDWNVIRDFQTLIVGFVGIGGVAATLLINANIPRWQRQREVDHEAGMLRRGLLTELGLIEDALDRGRKSVVEGIASKSLQQLSVADGFGRSFYAERISDLGLLTINEIGPVLVAYGAQEEFLRDVRSHGKPHPAGQYYQFGPNELPKVLELIERLSAAVAVAISELRIELHSGPYAKLVRTVS